MTTIVLGIALLASFGVLIYRERERAIQEKEQAKSWDLREGALLNERAELEQRHRAEQAEMESRRQEEKEASNEAFVNLNQLHAEEQGNWRKERSELLTRIQHPEVILPSIPVSDELARPREEHDEIDMVGSIADGLEDG